MTPNADVEIWKLEEYDRGSLLREHTEVKADIMLEADRMNGRLLNLRPDQEWVLSTSSRLQGFRVILMPSEGGPAHAYRLNRIDRDGTFEAILDVPETTEFRSPSANKSAVEAQKLQGVGFEGSVV